MSKSPAAESLNLVRCQRSPLNFSQEELATLHLFLHRDGHDVVAVNLENEESWRCHFHFRRLVTSFQAIYITCNLVFGLICPHQRLEADGT